jgi:orotidine-5'-phosphate decarboxylase
MNPLLVALDVADATRALALADTLHGAVGGYKVGHQLFTAAGPDVVRALVSRGDRVFLDLKYHDIPNTVGGAITSAAGLGVWMVNVHAGGGVPMMQAARRAADDAAASLGRPAPLLIAVTVLTSLDESTLRALGVPESPMAHAVRLARMTQDAGLDGVVSSPREIAAIREACGPDFVLVTPGLRGGSAASGPDDQQRTAAPAGAMAAGSSYLVVGRPITAAADPRSAAEAIGREIAAGASDRA